MLQTLPSPDQPTVVDVHGSQKQRLNSLVASLERSAWPRQVLDILYSTVWCIWVCTLVSNWIVFGAPADHANGPESCSAPWPASCAPASMPQGEDRPARCQHVLRHAYGLPPCSTASTKYTAFASYAVCWTAGWRRPCSCRHSRRAAWATFPSRQTSEPSIASNMLLRMHTVQSAQILRAPPP